ncbi:geminin isoform X3 [Sinocyclocheilus grahami]|uniref:geminin isoform X3 n=1 Tax=Sinocyclocheilus grahami TaxID=75366 RepID=UPI0007ACD8B1|nr:PREDICTED: geminin isoform X3 [Sinocyclocheilus grahami]
MSSIRRPKHAENPSENIKKFLVVPTSGSGRRTLQVLQPSAVNKSLGRIIENGKAVPKRKMWSAEQAKGSKRVKAEVAVRSTSPEDENQPEGVNQEAYELMIKETPGSSYWKEVAEERRKALFSVLQENEKRLTGKSPDSLEELREIAFDSEDEEEEQQEEYPEEQHADESQDHVELSTEQSHDHNVPQG